MIAATDGKRPRSRSPESAEPDEAVRRSSSLARLSEHPLWVPPDWTPGVMSTYSSWFAEKAKERFYRRRTGSRRSATVHGEQSSNRSPRDPGLLLGLRCIDFVITTEASSGSRWTDWPGRPVWRGILAALSRAAPRVDSCACQENSRPRWPPLISPQEFPGDGETGFWFKGMLGGPPKGGARGDLLIAPAPLALEDGQDCCVLGMLLRDRLEGTRSPPARRASATSNGGPNLTAPTCQPYTGVRHSG